jgi:exodeoxyribonuclease V alpha subunit
MSFAHQPALEKIEGITERVTYHSEETGYSVLRLRSKDHTDLVTVVGFASSITPGESLECVGEWTSNKDFGKQFKASLIRTIYPSTLEGIEKYLCSGLVKGIGAHLARNLVRTFGVHVFDVIENHPNQLRNAGGIGVKRIEKIVASWKDHKSIREIMVFLQSHGLPPAKGVRIFKTYGDHAVAKVQTNPYHLSRDVPGIGFHSADQIAQKLGIPKDAPIRARAGIHFILEESIQHGNCALPETELLRRAAGILRISPDLLKNALSEAVLEKTLMREEIDQVFWIYPCAIHHAETEVARLLSQLSSGPTPWKPLDFAVAVSGLKATIHITLADLQIEAVQTALSSKVTVITGGPGTGKSTLTRSIATLLSAQKVRMLFCSPTGRAAKRLSECTGLEAKTIHRSLGFNPRTGGFLHHEENPLPIDLLLIDEASMVDIQLAHALLRALPGSAAIVIVGDEDQLPSVGPGSFLRDVIASQTIPTVKLTQIFRQSTDSKIIQVAHDIHQGRNPSLINDRNSDFFFLQSEDEEETIQKILDLVKNRIPSKLGFDPIRDIQVLCPMQKGPLGAKNLNRALQKTLNPEPMATIERFGSIFGVGDKVMALQNDYEKDVYNGDLGFMISINRQDQECVIQFDDREILFEFSELDMLQTAYTLTIHKAQGSEYPVIIIPISMQHSVMLKRNLIYTAVTRGKKLVVLVGQKRALSRAIQSYQKSERFTHLERRLRSLNSSLEV